MGLGAYGCYRYPPMPGSRSVLTIGSFDGVHVAHAALVARARELAAGGARVVVMALDPHPATVLRPQSAPGRLTTFGQRAELLKRAGADEVVRLEPTPELLSLTPAEFVAGVVRDYAPVAFVEGPDFRFGKGRAGNVGTLAELGATYDFRVVLQEPVELALSDNTVVRASSTIARWLIQHGRVRDAALVLGREYELRGEVVRGDRRGRTIGYPTANLATECLPPADGVYSGSARLPDGREFLAAVSVGTKPTFGEHGRAVEAYLLDAPHEGAAIKGLPEYGWQLALTFSHWLRDQARYHTIEPLLEQMDRDCARARELAAAERSVAACR
jgi:riboflavin kinase / FMN adenylyltransferase